MFAAYFMQHWRVLFSERARAKYEGGAAHNNMWPK
jgi:hypothetical protein